MRTIIILVAASMLLCVCSAFAQMYDYRYTGPVNQYGYPKMEFMYRPQTQQSMQQYQGPLPGLQRQVHGFGRYLWSWMPAPLRGQQQYVPGVTPPSAGQSTVTFVPGH